MQLQARATGEASSVMSGCTPSAGRTARYSVARVLRCEGSEDGDGATGGLYPNLEKGRMPDPLQFAFAWRL